MLTGIGGGILRDAVLTAIALVVCALGIASELLQWRVPALHTASIPTVRD